MTAIKDKLFSGIYFGEKTSFFKAYILPILVFLNYSFLALFILALTCSRLLQVSSILEIPNAYWFIFLIGCPFLVLLIIIIIYSKHEFFEWDMSERKKKKEFQMIVMVVVVLCTYVFGFLTLQVSADFHISQSGSFTIEMFYSLLFLCNAIFTVPLHNVIYKDSLFQNNSISAKPKGWDWESDY
jgi:hypothetical protein